jgi:hypothetical protein
MTRKRFLLYALKIKIQSRRFDALNFRWSILSFLVCFLKVYNTIKAIVPYKRKKRHSLVSKTPTTVKNNRI